MDDPLDIMESRLEAGAEAVYYASPKNVSWVDAHPSVKALCRKQARAAYEAYTKRTLMPVEEWAGSTAVIIGRPPSVPIYSVSMADVNESLNEHSEVMYYPDSPYPFPAISVYALRKWVLSLASKSVPYEYGVALAGDLDDVEPFATEQRAIDASVSAWGDVPVCRRMAGEWEVL